MFFALMAIDGRGFSVNNDRARLVILGIFKNDQAQVDKYLEMLNPLLRRTTEGNVETISRLGMFRTALIVPCATSSYVTTNPVSDLSISRMIITSACSLLVSHPFTLVTNKNSSSSRSANAARAKGILRMSLP